MALQVLSYALNTTSSLNWVVRMAGELEQNATSVERILHQTNVTPEAPAEIPDMDPRDSWPSTGSIEFRNYRLAIISSPMSIQLPTSTFFL